MCTLNLRMTNMKTYYAITWVYIWLNSLRRNYVCLQSKRPHYFPSPSLKIDKVINISLSYVSVLDFYTSCFLVPLCYIILPLCNYISVLHAIPETLDTIREKTQLTLCLVQNRNLMVSVSLLHPNSWAKLTYHP